MADLTSAPYLISTSGTLVDLSYPRLAQVMLGSTENATSFVFCEGPTSSLSLSSQGCKVDSSQTLDRDRDDARCDVIDALNHWGHITSLVIESAMEEMVSRRAMFRI